MNTIRTFGLAAVAALSLGIGAAMAQESPGNDTMSGTTWPPPVVPGSVQATQPSTVVQSGSSDVQNQQSTTTTTTTTNGRPFWTPGVAY